MGVLASRRSHLFLVSLVLAALVGVALLAIPGSPAHKSLRKGLDLQGGLEVVLQAVPPKGHELTTEDLDRSIEVMRARVDRLGVSEPEIRKQGSNQIVIQLAGVHDTATALSIIGKTAQLELYDLESALYPGISIGSNGVPVANSRLFDLLSRVQKGQKGTPSAYYLFKKAGKGEKTWRVIAGPSPTLHDPENGLLRKFRDKQPAGTRILSVPAKTVVITCSAESSVVCPDQNGGAQLTGKQKYFYLFKNGAYKNDRLSPYPQMKGDMLKLTGTRQDFDPQSGEPIVTMQFTGKGNKVFRDITKEEAQRGSIRGFDQHFAIVLDNELRSYPSIDHQKYPNGIDPTAGGAQITGMAGLQEAKNLALVLQTGALPVSFDTVERSDVSATLGADSLREARNAAIGGLIAVVIFLLVLYRFLGLVAVIGLGIYCAFMYAALLLLDVTLTLPGFAGLILTIGVAADANVIIFERIKEEVRAGKSVKAAIAGGYQKGFHTIVDANVVTCITALILFAVATAGVKGFALTLLIGTVISLITAVAATRAMLGLLAGFKWFEDPRFMGATGAEIPKWQRIDVVGRRRLWLTLSLVAVALSVVAIAVKGLNLGIDFKGGVQVTFTTPQPTSLSDVRNEITQNGAVVQGRGQATSSETYKSFQVRLENLRPNEQAALTNKLTEDLNAQKLGVKNVSASFSRQILRGAIVSIVVSFALIALYVTLRYQWRFAVPILRTLLNDIPIALGVYAISGREVSASTVAAFLTILGYSVYDTIIVFDRVRENMKLMPRASIATIANLSVWEVLRRSIVTSVITLLPIVALFIFGGATLQDFAFAIMVGITIGAVSTIFIATPLLTQLMERDPEYARRKDAPMDDEAVTRRLLRHAEQAAAAEPAPETPVDVIEETVAAIADGGDGAESDAKRERRRQRRRSRPHGRAR